MKNFNRIISTLLAVVMLVSSFAITTFAEDSTTRTAPEYNTKGTQTLDYFKGYIIDSMEDVDNKTNYTYAQDAEGKNIVVDTAAEKLSTMDLRVEKDGFRLYVDEYTGEVAAECVATGETLFTNPFNVGVSKATESIKSQLLSQLSVRYADNTTGTEYTYYSFTEASQRNQIIVKNIKGGIRVEYSIGREQSKILVPVMMEESDFIEQIVNPLKEALGEDSYDFGKFMAFYIRMDKEDFSETELKRFPLLQKMVYYRLDEKTSDVQKFRLEDYIKNYAPDFTFEDLDEAHLKTEYQAEDNNPPLFKMALEYSVDPNGLNVRLPANGIRFNESLYSVKSIDILPYMGAASSEGDGYTFFPDGSGALFDFAKIQEMGTTTTITGKVYGQDFAYHTISGTHQETIRYPVYGIVGSNTITVIEEEEAPTVDDTTDVGDEETEVTEAEDEITTYADDTLLISPAPTPAPAVTTDIQRQSGFVAIVEEGDAMMEISTYHETQAHEYNTIKLTVYPRPQDTYNLANAISVGSSSEWTVVSSRKYTGSYRIKYVFLTPDEVAEEKGIDEYYECSYVGMALAYRDYLIEKGILTRLNESDVKKDIPLYIETFGTMYTIEKFLSIPFNVLSPLTTFEDIKTMYDDLSLEGITNVNFKLTGYANGGMNETVPYRLKWEKSVGGKKGFEELMEYAKEKDFGVYPDFDFVFISTTGAFDGVSLKQHAVKTIDDRYTSRREYSATKQTHISYYELAISPACFSRFYEKLTDNYLKYEPTGISVSTLGSYLNSDFDEDEPYNREDSVEFTKKAFEYLYENYESVMTSGGNSYTWKYVDHITDVALDSSRYAQSAASVPFLGIVLHGYVQIAGTPINMEGNTNYALLKAIESGAGINFLLSYRNTENLKDDEYLSKYYSVRYDIWFDDVVGLYNELNALLADVQTSVIVDHQFVDGIRVPDDDELAADAAAEIEAALKAEAERLAAAVESERISLMNARLNIQKGYSSLTESVAALENAISKLKIDSTGAEYKVLIDQYISDYNTESEKLAVLTAELDELLAAETPDEEAIAAKQAEVDAQTKLANTKKSAINLCYYNTLLFTSNAVKAYDTLDAMAVAAEEGYELLVADGTANEALLAELKRMSDAIVAEYDKIAHQREEIIAYADEMFSKVEGVLEGAKKYEDTATTDGSAAQDVTETEEIIPAKYRSDDNMIVYVEYENGKAFLLNFNNYDVKAEFNGVVYAIDAYGYLVLGAAN